MGEVLCRQHSRLILCAAPAQPCLSLLPNLVCHSCLTLYATAARSRLEQSREKQCGLRQQVASQAAELRLMQEKLAEFSVQASLNRSGVGSHQVRLLQLGLYPHTAGQGMQLSGTLARAPADVALRF